MFRFIFREPHLDSYDEVYGGESYSEEPSFTMKSRPTYKQSLPEPPSLFTHTPWSTQDDGEAREGLCIGCPRLVGRWKARNSNMQEIFCTTLMYSTIHPSL